MNPNSVGAIGPAARSMSPVDKFSGGNAASHTRAQRHRRDIAAQQAAARGEGRQSRRGVRGGRTARDGKGVPRDPKAAAKFWSAPQAGPRPGAVPARRRIREGHRRHRDLVAARTWYLRAAERGNAKAMHNLGVLLADGAGAQARLCRARRTGSARPPSSACATASTTSPSSRRAASALPQRPRRVLGLVRPRRRRRATRTPAASATKSPPARRRGPRHGQGRRAGVPAEALDAGRQRGSRACRRLGRRRRRRPARRTRTKLTRC